MTSGPPVERDGRRRPVLFLICRDVGDHALLVGDHLHPTWHVAYIDQQAIDLSRPHEWVQVNEALQHPGRVHAVRVQSVGNDPSLGTGRALADAKRGADLCHGHVRLRRLVRQEVELAQYVDDAAGPGARLPRGQWAWALT